MFRIAVITNENEVAHSSFADTVSILKRPVTLKNQKTDSYTFSEFDKFTAARLFREGHQEYLLGFDSLIIATNATNNGEVLGALRNGRDTLERFIASGRGILVLSQKKLSAQSVDSQHVTGFLPERFDYALLDRPESSSADGSIDIAEVDDRILNYPNAITEKMIARHCTENQFMEHRYRSILAPSKTNQFIAVLVDRTSSAAINLPQMGFPSGRPLLIRTASSKERIVATTMALDWAGHEELLENLLVYITEGQEQIAVLRQHGTTQDDPIDVYTTRARAAKLPIREYFDVDVANYKLPKHRAIVVSPAYSSDDVETIWQLLSRTSNHNVDLYHLSATARGSEFQLHRRSFSNSANHLALSGALWIQRSFIPTLWGKSIWTYNYALPALRELELDISPFAEPVLADIQKHIRLPASGGASYDHVPNATAQLLELLSKCLPSLEIDGISLNTADLIKKCEIWIVEALTDGSRISPRDRLYLMNSLQRADRLVGLGQRQLQQLRAIATETMQHYRQAGVNNAETVELTQWLELELVEAKISESNAALIAAEALAIVSELKNRQNIEGGWKNVSVTGDVLVAVLRSAEESSSIRNHSAVKDMIAKGVEFLVRSFDKKNGNWSNDINATAKASRALVMFDKHKGLSSADFLSDIHARAEMLQFSDFCVESFKHDSALLSALLHSEATLKKANEKLVNAERQVARSSRREKLGRVIAFGFLVIALISSASFGLVTWILKVNFPDAMAGILGKWDEYLVGGFVSIILTLVFMGVYSFAQTRLIKAKEGKD